MKCSLCTWKSSPESNIALARHVNDSHFGTDGIQVVWQDAELTVVKDLEDPKDLVDVVLFKVPDRDVVAEEQKSLDEEIQARWAAEEQAVEELAANAEQQAMEQIL